MQQVCCLCCRFSPEFVFFSERNHERCRYSCRCQCGMPPVRLVEEMAQEIVAGEDQRTTDDWQFEKSVSWTLFWNEMNTFITFLLLWYFFAVVTILSEMWYVLCYRCVFGGEVHRLLMALYLPRSHLRLPLCHSTRPRAGTNARHHLTASLYFEQDIF